MEATVEAPVDLLVIHESVLGGRRRPGGGGAASSASSLEQ